MVEGTLVAEERWAVAFEAKVEEEWWAVAFEAKVVEGMLVVEERWVVAIEVKVVEECWAVAFEAKVVEGTLVVEWWAVGSEVVDVLASDSKAAVMSVSMAISAGAWGAVVTMASGKQVVWAVQVSTTHRPWHKHGTQIASTQIRCRGELHARAHNVHASPQRKCFATRLARWTRASQYANGLNRAQCPARERTPGKPQ